jgi:hypothetical protein
MPRAEQPVTQAEVSSLPEYHPAHTAEGKVEDYGRHVGSVVAVDYGLGFAETVIEKRRYYATFNGPAIVVSEEWSQQSCGL